MCYPVCGMVHIKEPLLLIGKSSPCDSSGFIIIINSNKAVHIGLHFGTNRNMYVLHACMRACMFMLLCNISTHYFIHYWLKKRFGK